MEIVLFNAPVLVRSPHAGLTLPLGLAYVGAALMEEGYGVSAIDSNVSGLNLKQVANVLAWDKPKIIGISAHTETYSGALEIARYVKNADDRVKIVFGGAHPSIMPERVLGEAAVDYVVIGEGEQTMVELAKFVLEGSGDPAAIQGLAYKADDGTPIVNPRRRLLSPDELPYPARDLFPIEFYQEKWNILTARGSCPFKCSFCSASHIWEGRRRPRSIPSTIDELKVLIEYYGARHVFFTDDIFTVNKKWVYELLEALSELEYPLTWGCATRVDCVDGKLIKAMAGAGCVGVQYGVESGSQAVLDSVKGIRKEQVLEAVRLSVDAGISVTSSFMIPFPEDTVETLRETKLFIKQVIDEGSEVLMSYTTPYPGTDFYERAQELGLTILTENWDEYDAKHNIIETKHLSGAQINDSMEEIACYAGLAKRVATQYTPPPTC